MLGAFDMAPARGMGALEIARGKRDHDLAVLAVGDGEAAALDEAAGAKQMQLPDAASQRRERRSPPRV